MPITNVGKCFATPAAFLDYLDDLSFGAWRPRFVTVHHTGSPTLKNWHGWQKRSDPVTDEEWMHNLAGYYGGLGWSAGPHFFITPRHICVLSPPTRRGVHAVSFNAVSWGVETVGDFDVEPFEGPIRDNLVGALAAMHIAAGLQPDPFQKGVRGLHFHRDDPKTSKTCPGRNVAKAPLVAAVKAKMAEMADGDHPAEKVEAGKPLEARGTVNADRLSLRMAASAKAPSIETLAKGASVSITGRAMNGDTLWLSVTVNGKPGWVAGRYIDQD
jgi:hypothetical protein